MTYMIGLIPTASKMVTIVGKNRKNTVDLHHFGVCEQFKTELCASYYEPRLIFILLLRMHYVEEFHFFGI